jgi:hypothetical protein
MTQTLNIDEKVEDDNQANLRGVEALIFDVFGTVVNWFGSVTEELRRFGGRKNLSGLCARIPDVAVQFTLEFDRF